jgi:hypothetical protein
MKKILTTVVSALACLVVGLSSAMAQDESDVPDWTPVETFTCDYLDGKGPGDLAEVVDEWNAWWDKKGLNSYFAVTITPYYYGENNFDLGWIGVWSDGNAMGSSLDTWVTEGSDLGGKFFDVIECSSHSNFASVNIRPPSGDAPDSMLLSFSNCSLEDEKTFSDFLAAQEEWNAYADEHGFETGEWAMFPVAGEVNDDYDFKLVTSEANHTVAGANWQLYADGHYRKSNELFGPVVDCDSSRVYSADVRRRIKSEEE